MYCPSCGTAASENYRYCARCGALLPGNSPRPGAGANPDIALQVPAVAAPESNSTILGTEVYAGFWRRCAAILVDMALILIVDVALIAALTVASPKAHDGAQATVTLIMMVAGWLYFALFESSKLQGTPGKLVLRIRVTDLQGSRIGFWHSTGRNVARILSGIPLYTGYIAAGISRRRQAFHDMVANTLVVKRKYSPAQVASVSSAAAESDASGVVIAVAAVIAVIVLLGALAAIAIPAYQNYTIRAQVTEGLVLAGGFKTAIAEAIAAQGWKPRDISSETLGVVGPTQGKYVANMQVVSGAIVITYGNAANVPLTNKTLVIYPGRNDNGDVVFICGRAQVPAGIKPVITGGEKYTTVDSQYLPSSCH